MSAFYADKATKVFLPAIPKQTIKVSIFAGSGYFDVLKLYV